MASIDPDIIDRVRLDFPPEQAPEVIQRLDALGGSQRVLRCIVFAARGHQWYFDFLCRLAACDYRDVILAAEYTRFGDRLYDFSQPLPQSMIAQPNRSVEDRP